MKNILVSLTLLVAIFTSCHKELRDSKESIQLTTLNKKVTSTKGVSFKFNKVTFNYKKSFAARQITTPSGNAPWIAFDDCGEYERLLDTLDATDKAGFINTLKTEDFYFSLNDAAVYDPGYTIVDGDTVVNAYDPLYEAAFAKENADSIDNDFFGDVLNPDGVVQIGDYILRINAISGHCYVLEAANISDYSDLIAENTGNTNITEYSNEDDVMDILFGENVQSRLFCSEDGTSAYKDDGNEYYSTYSTYPQCRLECKVVYQKYAIYFALVSKMDYTHHGLIGWNSTTSYTWDAMTAYYQWKYKVKCKSEEIQTATTYTGSANNNAFVLRPYEGSKGLRKYDLQYQWGVTGDEATNHTYKLSRVYRVTSGY